MAKFRISSNHAILDVKHGRRKLDRFISADDKARVPVVIHGYINGIWGHDDGVSISFCVDVTSIKCGEGEHVQSDR